MVFQCKQCGALLTMKNDKLVCEYCGATYAKKEFDQVVNVDVKDVIKNMETRIFLLLEEGAFSNAEKLCKKLLELDSMNPYAYLGKLFVDLNIRKKEDIGTLSKTFENNYNYIHFMRFASEALKNEILQYINELENKLKLKEREAYYQDLLQQKESACSEEAFLQLHQAFLSLGEYLDASSFAQECLEKATFWKSESVYLKAKELMMKNTIEDYDQAIIMFESLNDWKDARLLASRCRERKAALLGDQQEQSQKSKSKVPLIIALVAIVLLSIMMIVMSMGDDQSSEKAEYYQQAMNDKNSGRYYDAYQKFHSLLDYEDAIAQSEICMDLAYGEGTWDNYQSVLQQRYYTYGENEWIPLEYVMNDTTCAVLMLSKDSVGSKQYDKTLKTSDWENSLICKWLNEEYLHDVFTSEEQKRILPYYGDSIFLLSENEVMNPAYEEALTRDEVNEWFIRINETSDICKLVKSYGNIQIREVGMGELGAVRPAFILNLGTSK